MDKDLFNLISNTNNVEHETLQAIINDWKHRPQDSYSEEELAEVIDCYKSAPESIDMNNNMIRIFETRRDQAISEQELFAIQALIDQYIVLNSDQEELRTIAHNIIMSNFADSETRLSSDDLLS